MDRTGVIDRYVNPSPREMSLEFPSPGQDPARFKCWYGLLPTESEEREVLGVGCIHVATLPSCQNMKIIALQLHNMNIVG